MKRHRIAHRSVRASFWRAATAAVWVADREHALVAAINEATGEVKYFLTNAATAPLTRVLAVAFSRWRVERGHQQMKEELGLDHFEGRSWRGFHHHAAMVLLAYGFLLLEHKRPRPSPTGAVKRGRPNHR